MEGKKETKRRVKRGGKEVREISNAPAECMKDKRVDNGAVGENIKSWAN
jgi:hypothetical protein